MLQAERQRDVLTVHQDVENDVAVVRHERKPARPGVSAQHGDDLRRPGERPDRQLAVDAVEAAPRPHGVARQPWSTSSNAPATSNACPAPTDARARLVRIAERGARAVPIAAAAVAEVEAEWTAHLGAGRTDMLRVILADLRTITDPYDG
ncbi:hypothetical protein [Actinoplanes sp. URMC 104]|uniref:hypothetical protein n=1 Tax=Actinoplanes sp. URMC 104 TaxID=3423409 RepID=UPI003F1E1680